jgi:uncharacterized membrane protein YczE
MLNNIRYARWFLWGQLLVGLVCYGVAIAFMLDSHLGLGPWDMFHQGLSYQTGWSVGRISQVVGFVILALLLFVKIRPGWGTVFNIVLIGQVTDWVMPLLPDPTGVPLRFAMFVAGVFICGMGTGLYIGARLGAGPRDSLMLWLNQRTGWPVRRVRTLMEIVVLLCGWALGGTIGLGTLLFAFGIGPAAQLGLHWFDTANRPPQALPQSELA